MDELVRKSFKQVKPFDFGKNLALEMIKFAEEQMKVLGLDDNDQIDFWLGFHSGITNVE